MGTLRALGIVYIFTVSFPFLTGCSSESAAGTAPASYAGLTTQAGITADNSEALAETALDGAAPGDSGLANASSSPNSVDEEQLIGIARSLNSALRGVDMSRASTGQSATATVTSASNTDTSPCGGTLGYSFSYDDVSGAFTGTFNFNSYVDCADNSKITGSVTLDGTLLLANLELTTATMTFSALTYEEGSESMTLTGDIVMEYISLWNYKATMNMDFRDNVQNETYRLQNYIVDITQNFASSYIDVDISGKAYHPNYGYVTVSTTTLVRIYDGDANPTSGVVELLGSGASKVMVTFTTNDTYTMDIDSDGDTTFETSKSCTWSTDTCI